MAELLADKRVSSQAELEAVFATFDSERRSRGHWLVQSSRWIGDCYEWRAEGIGRDFKKIEDEINRRNDIIANVNMNEMCEHAIQELGKRLA